MRSLDGGSRRPRLPDGGSATKTVRAAEGRDEWTLFSQPRAPVVQYEHTVVATDRGAIIVTLPH